MEFDNFSKPTLIEPGVKYFLNETLKQCNVIRNEYNNTIFNIGLFFIFCIILAFVLLYKYKGRLSPIEIQKKNRDKQQYILSKVKQLQEAKKRAHQELITGLPVWENEYSNVQKNNNI